MAVTEAGATARHRRARQPWLAVRGSPGHDAEKEAPRGGCPSTCVEDDFRLRATLVGGLTEHGMVVSAVSDGRAAVAAAVDGDPVDVIVLDIGLPDSDGRDVCQALRLRGIWVPVLYLTARGDVTDVLSGYAAGGDDYLAKPFHFAELVARLRALTRRADTQRPARGVSPGHLDAIVSCDAIHDQVDPAGVPAARWAGTVCRRKPVRSSSGSARASVPWTMIRCRRPPIRHIPARTPRGGGH